MSKAGTTVVSSTEPLHEHLDLWFESASTSSLEKGSTPASSYGPNVTPRSSTSCLKNATKTQLINLTRCAEEERDYWHSAWHDSEVGRVSARTHATILGMEMDQLKYRANKKEVDSGRIPLNVHARLLTGGSGEIEVRELAKARAETLQAKAEAEARKVARDDARTKDRQANAAIRVFEGPVSKSKRKGELEEMAYSLSLLEEDPGAATELRADGTIAVLIERIKSYLLAHSHLESNPRFADLYPNNRQGKRRRVHTHETASEGDQPAVRQRLENATAAASD